MWKQKRSRLNFDVAVNHERYELSPWNRPNRSPECIYCYLKELGSKSPYGGNAAVIQEPRLPPL